MKKILSLLFSFCLPTCFFGQNSESLTVQTQPSGITVAQFNNKLKTTSRPLLVNFTADWCVVCKRQKPVLTAVMGEVGAQIELMVIDMELNPLIAEYFEVDGLPVTILYDKGNMVWNRVGFQDRAQILSQVYMLVEKKQP
ncbi:MAG: thioredoxin family protein [Bacteroidota bacterium]